MKIAFIGLGRMGQAMAGRLLDAGQDVLLYNRTPEKLAALVAKGGRVAVSVAEAASEADLIITMLSDDEALRKVALDPGGIVGSAPAGAIHMAMGTHDVQFIRSVAEAHAEAGQSFVAAPVLGRPEAVADGKAGVVVGGDPAAVSKCTLILNILGRRTFAAGADPGSAAAMKLANNFLLACAIEAMGEAFSLALKNGVDNNVFHDMITDGLFASPAYNTYARIIADKSYDKVGFTVALALKDVDLALAAGAAAGVPLPSGNICRERLLGAIANGDAQKDWASMAHEQARASGLA